MPGNEIGDRVYNFFDQNSFSQNQRHTQFADASWPGFHNNVWGENERQNSVPLNSTSKCYNDQQSGTERGNNQFSPASHGLNITQSNVRPEFVRSPSQVQQLNLNGFMQTHQVGNSRQNDANFLAGDRGSDQHNITSRVPSIFETQQRSVQQHSNSAGFGGAEAPMNFNFLGSQQQMSSQQPGMLNDGRLMQQQAIMKQMQELQRRQQLQQFEAMQNAMNHMSNFPSQSAGHHSLANNSNPMQNTSNNPWQSQVMAGGTNWQQPGNPYFNGLMVNPEQGQAMRFTGLTPQQASQSLYGVPVSNSAGVQRFQQNSVERPGVSHIPAHSNTFSGNSYAPHLEQVSTQDASTTSRLEGKVSFEHPFSQGLQNAANLGGSNQVQERKASIPDGNERGFVGASDESSEKSLMQAAASQSISSQAGVGLDPTEEKILFGNDDNIWEAFGGAAVTGNDGPDVFNGFPSMQNGTWSALMQSAVGETSNSDGMQEEWNGLDSETSRSQPSNQHLPTPHDNGKPPPAWVDSSQRASLGGRMTNNDVNNSNATIDTNYLNNSRLLQSHSNQGTSSVENQARQEGRRWLDSNSPKPHTEEKCDSKPDTAFWSHRPSTFLPESVPASNTNSKVDSNGPSLSHINNSPVTHQMPPDNHSLDLWKQFNFASKSGTVGHGNDQHNMNKGQSVVGSSGNTPSGGVAEMPGIQNGDGRVNSSDIQQNSISNYALSGSSRENVWPDAGDRQSLPPPQEISSGPAGRRVGHKFQYHPMKDMNVDESSSAKQLVHSQSMSPSMGPRVNDVQPTLLGQAGFSSADMEKGPVSGFHGGVKMLHNTLSSNVHPGQIPRTSVPFGSSAENPSPNQRPSPSQNMLELLHKVDQSKEQNSVSNLGSSLVNSYHKSDTPADGCVGPGQSQSSMSHGFNLQLAPPSQGTALSNLNDPAQSSLRSVASPGSQIVSSGKGDTTQAWLPSSSSTLSSPPSHRPAQMDFGNSEQLMADHKSSFISSDSHGYHDPQPVNSHSQVAVSQSTSNLYNNSMSEGMNLSGVRASMYQMQPSLNAVMDGMKVNMPLIGSSSWSSQQQLSGIQAHNSSDFVKSHFQSNDSLDTNVTSQQKKHEVHYPTQTDVSLEVDPQPSAKVIGLSQDTYLRRQSTEASHVNSAASHKEADVFNHSLKPNNTANYNYSLLQQMQTMKAMGMDPNHQESKRLKGSEIGQDAPQMTSYSTVRDPSVSQTSMSSGDAKMVSFPPQVGNNNISLLPPGAVASQDGFSSGHSDPQTCVNVPNRAQLAGISPQMAPSWFERFGTFRNGQLLPVHNVPRVPMVKNVEQQLIKPPINMVDTCQISGTDQISNVCSATEHISSLHALAPAASPIPVSTRLKKRKTETSDLIPWNKEIGQGIKKVQNLSSAEVEWAQSSNRLVERGGDETDFHEYLSPMVRPGRRLILTTKLMQQVFCPPPASILSLDGRCNYEVIMYSVARLALADASNLICGVESDTPADNGVSLTAKAKTSERIHDQYFLKVLEDFMNRANELENDLLRLDKSASILDFRLDCQDLERFSVINRFARFHARSQVDGVETSSSSNANAASQKPFPQRYVTAHPMPGTVPERVQCLNIN